MIASYFDLNDVTIYCGDARAILRDLPDASVNCCVTSPPYWGLRDYGVPGQIGLEATPEEYVARMVEVFREVRRVLRDDGTLWINLGDSYARDSGKGEKFRNGKGHRWSGQNPNGMTGPEISDGLKPKDLVGIPWMVAFARRADGWYLRSDIIWHKPNPTPESVTDRPTKAHEYLFLLSKSERYYYDAEAIREESITQDPRKPYCPGQVDARGNGHDRGGGKIRGPLVGSHGTRGHDGNGMRMPDKWNNPLGRNKRSVWTVATQPFPEAHFATFPEDLIKPCILAGCPRDGMVLDPFGGAGTVAVVARNLWRRAVLIELNEKYCKMAADRHQSHVLPMEEICAAACDTNGSLLF